MLKHNVKAECCHVGSGACALELHELELFATLCIKALLIVVPSFDMRHAGKHSCVRACVRACCVCVWEMSYVPYISFMSYVPYMS
jgi:hypothetical protein